MAKGTLTPPQRADYAAPTGKTTAPEKENKAALVIPRAHDKDATEQVFRDQQQFDRAVKERLEAVERSVGDLNSSDLGSRFQTLVNQLNGAPDSEDSDFQEVFIDEQPVISRPAISFTDAGNANYPTLDKMSVNS